jgi:hypothetical protein
MEFYVSKGGCFFLFERISKNEKKKNCAKKNMYERKNATETLRDVFLLHATTLLLSLVASRERERERERFERGVFDDDAIQRARARQKRAGGDFVSETTNDLVLFVCLFFFFGAKGGEGSVVSEEVNARSSSSSA